MSTDRQPSRHRPGEEGYLLLGLVVACFLLLLALSVAAPRVSKDLERQRELESEHRALEYVRAIQLFYKKNGTYPTSVEQLLGSSTSGASVSIGPGASVKYLRQKYKDPLTNDEFRLIHTNEAKTQVKGFFGEPLQGNSAGNLGSVQGMVSNLNSTPAGTFGGSSATGSPASASSSTTGGSSGSSFGSSAFNNSGSGTSTGTGATGTGTGGTGTTGSGSSTDATTFQGSKGAFVGVGSNAKGPGQLEWNGSANIEEWEFLYDPRVELLKAKVSLFGGAPAASGSGSMGSGFGSATGTGTGTGSSSSFGSGSSTGSSSGFGSGSSSSFGSGSSSGFGSGSSSGFGSGSSSGFGSGNSSSPTSGTGTTGTGATTGGTGTTGTGTTTPTPTNP
jgi:hypothetical protein